MKHRLELDSLGEVRVPATAYFGAQTARALANFPDTGHRFPRPFLCALGQVKLAAAETNAELGTLAVEPAGWIAQAAREVEAGVLDDHFPLSVWISGSGTQVNMNANEVIAGRANELASGRRGGKSPVHPNDHVNLGQSSNDVVPTAIHIAAAVEIASELLPAVDELRDALAERGRAFAAVIKTGRTHLMDAVPLTLGQEFGGLAAQLAAARELVAATLPGLHELALGGTAVGTGLGAPPGFADGTVRRLAIATGLPLRRAANPFAVQGAHDAVVAASAGLRGLAVALTKITADIRLLGSGPRCGIGELRFPANEPGSSMMPGKVNPTQAESLAMICARVLGNDAAVVLGGAGGHLQMNASKPLLLHCLLESVDLLAAGCRSFARRCVVGIEPDRKAVAALLERSLMLVTALVPRLGHDRAAEVAGRAVAEGLTLRETLAVMKLLGAAEAERLLDPGALTGSDTPPADSPGGGPRA